MRWLMVVLLLTGCTAPPAPVPAERFAANPSKYEAIVRAARERLEEPDDGPADGECENCNGTGQIGDGRTMMDCPVCGGTGKATGAVDDDPNDLYPDEPDIEARRGGRLKLKSRPDCDPCKAFVARDWPEIQKALPTWQLEVIDDNASGTVPTIEIETHDGRTFTHRGRLSLQELQEYVNR